MPTWLKWTGIVAVAGLVVIDLVALNIHVLNSQSQAVSPNAFESSSAAQGEDTWWYPPSDKPQYWEWRRRQSCYVSDRADLSRPVDQDYLDHLHQQIGKYFEVSGLDMSDPRDLRFAWAYDGIILRFCLGACRRT